MAEYKLSYTAKEIDKKLGKVDSAILFESQTLTNAQKEQVKENIGALDEIYVGNDSMPDGATIQILMDGSDEEQALIDELKDYIDGEIEKVTPIKGVDYFDGSDGRDGANGVSASHSWNGTTLTVTSASGTSSANLKGDKGDKGDTYTLTSSDKTSIANIVKSSLPTLILVGTDADGVAHTWTIYGS